MVIFKSKQKKFEGDLKIKLCGKRLYPTESVRYLGIKIDTNLSWQYHVNHLSIKLNRVNALLFKMRKYVILKILRSTNYNFTKKTVRTIDFQQRNFHNSPLFKQNSILKFHDKISLEIFYLSANL